MKSLCLCSGIGCFALAAEWAGFETVAFCEIDPFCQQVLRKNFGDDIEIHDDIRTLDGRRFRGTDLVTAAIPCQPFSVAGSRKGVSDERFLWTETLRILCETQAQWFMGENVPGLLTDDDGKTWGRIIRELGEVGYRVGWLSYGAKDVGACHKRDRVFWVAYAESPKRSRTRNSRTRRNWFAGIFSTSYSGCFGRNNWVDHRQGRQVRNLEVRQIEENKQKWHRWQSRPGQNDDDATDSPRLLGNESGDKSKRKIPEPRDCDRSRDWRTWDIEPVIRRSDDVATRRMDEDRLKALGNCCPPAQYYPVLKAIADAIQSNVP